MTALILPTPVPEYNPYPEATCDTVAVGFKIVVQIRSPRLKSKGGIMMPDSVQDTALYFTDVGRVVSVGPMAFRNRDTGAEWAGGAWCKAGDFIRIRPASSTLKYWMRDNARFVVITDEDVEGVVDPSAARDE